MSWDDLFDSMEPRAIREFSAGMGKARTYGESEVERLKRQLGELEEERDTLRAQRRRYDVTEARARRAELHVRQLQVKVAELKAGWNPAARPSALPLKKLLKLCHPDRWQGTDLEALANELTQLINTERKT